MVSTRAGLDQLLPLQVIALPTPSLAAQNVEDEHEIDTNSLDESIGLVQGSAGVVADVSH